MFLVPMNWAGFEFIEKICVNCKCFIQQGKIHLGNFWASRTTRGNDICLRDKPELNISNFSKHSL